MGDLKETIESHESTKAALVEAVEEIKRHLKTIEKYEKIIRGIHESCLCDRNTKGYDYHEKHPRLGMPQSGSRWKTPVDIIEHVIGFEWRYEKPKGVGGASWKELKFVVLPPKKEGFK